MTEEKPHPVSINLHKKSRRLVISFDDDSTFELSCEYLRVFSPSAEVKGHGPGQEVLQLDKENVNIDEIEPIGHYAVKLHFDDGHDSGIYSWEYLYDLGINFDNYWNSYQEALEKAGHRKERQ
ncbi:MAG: gamma-butyrobetaine hydroxylase-like domain-containing protein [Gammaproteobacteria bacterium]